MKTESKVVNVGVYTAPAGYKIIAVIPSGSVTLKGKATSLTSGMDIATDGDYSTGDGLLFATALFSVSLSEIEVTSGTCVAIVKLISG